MESPYTFRARTLSQGISTQAPVMRPDTQLEDAENIIFSITKGAVRRPGSSIVSILDATPQDGRAYGLHRIERDDDEQYLIVFGQSLFEIIDVKTGAKANLTMKATSATYLALGGATREDLRFLTIGDTTFVLNRKVATGMSSSTKFDAAVMPHSLKRTSVSPLTFEMTQTPWTERNFKEQVISGTATTGEFRLRYRGDTTTRYTSTTDEIAFDHIDFDAPASRFEEGNEGNGVQQYLGELNSITRGKVLCTGGPLPDQEIVCEISEDLVPGDGACTLNSNGFAQAASGDLIQVVNFSGDQNYTVTRGNDNRNPPPDPIKNNQTLSDMSYYRGRLVLASSDTLMFSRVDELFNFFIEKPAAISDADPIELTIASDDVADIDFVVAFKGSLLVMTRQGRQYVLEDVDSLTATTAALTPGTRYETQLVKPTSLGSNLYLVGRKAGSSNVLQYFYDDLAGGNKALDVSKQIDGLIPENCGGIDGSASSSTLVVTTDVTSASLTPSEYLSRQTGVWKTFSTWKEDPDGDGTFTNLVSGELTPQAYDTCTIAAGHTITFSGYEEDTSLTNTGAAIYTYRWYDVGNSREQSAWSRWTYSTSLIQDVKVIDDIAYLLRFEESDYAGDEKRLYIDSVSLDEDGPKHSGFTRHIHMDRQIKPASASYSSSSPQGTTFTMTAADSNGDTRNLKGSDFDTIVLGPEYTSSTDESLEGYELTITSTTNNQIFCSSGDNLDFFGIKVNGVVQSVGDFSAGTVYAGKRLESAITLTEPFFRDQGGNPIQQGRLTIDKIIVDHTQTGTFTIEMIPDTGATQTRTKRGVSPSQVPYKNIDDGPEQVQAGFNAKTTTIKVKQTDVLPGKFNAYELQGRFSTPSF
jgi:hypothetical protein